MIRLLAYYTFATGDLEDGKNYHPVIYFHGFPGSGIEGGVCAKSAARFQCKLYAIDRPGFGSSEPLTLDKTESADDYIAAVVRDVWDFVRRMNWPKFSIVAVSGGGPFAQAMLESYMLTKLGIDTSVPTLEAISVVAGVCCSAGTEGMMPQNQALCRLIMKDSFWSRLLLRIQFSLQRFLLRYFPEKLIISMSKPMLRYCPQVDKEVFSNAVIQHHFIENAKEAIRQSAEPLFIESRVLFRAHQGFESSLREKWSQACSEGKKVPRVTIFQGKLDVNVPPSHSRYVHRELLCGTSLLREYPYLGHVSLVVRKADEYMQSAAL